MSKPDYLAWMDLEMTGLDSLHDHIIEIATLMTDIDLNIVEIGPEIVIYQEEEILEEMNDWCQKQHTQSGLVDRVRASRITTPMAEKQTLDFLKKYVKEGKAPLCGNSIHQDRAFLKRHMPTLDRYLHYRNIDISSIKELAFRWYPNLKKYQKQGNHTALEDIKESIDELRYYRKHIFA
jgi:oligoribonuclease